MQDKWKDLIPFYVAGTLSDRDKQALEAYLIQCGDPCQDEVEEWRIIASATWQQVNVNLPDLPPLSQTVLDEVAKDAPLRASGKIVTSNAFNGDDYNPTNAPVYPRQASTSTKKIRRSPRVPLTMVAAFMTVVIFGGILLSQLTPNDLDPQTQVIELTDSIDIPSNVTEEFGGQIGIVPDNPNDSGIIQTPTAIAPQPTATGTPTAPPLPTQLGTLPFGGGGGDTSSIASLPTSGECMIRNATQGALTTYRDASFDARPVNVFPEGAQAPIRVIYNGWYELSYGNWVYGENVIQFGDCSNVWTATPTAIGDNPDFIPTDDGIPDCTVRNDSEETLMLYQWPDFNSPANGRMTPGTSSNVVIGANGWYQVHYAQWVNGADVTVEGTGCNSLWIPTPTTSPNGTPTPLPTASGSPIAVVITDFTLLRGSPATTGMFVEQVPQGTNLAVIAHNHVSGAERWYLVRSPAGRTGWVPVIDVQVIPNDMDVLPAATVPFIPSATPQGFVPTPAIERWSHITTIVEHGCGGTVGAQETINVQIQNLGSQLVMTYPDTGASFTLNNIAPNSFSGSYETSAVIQVDLSFTSGTTYLANETITHESGCIVRITWAGTKQ